MPEVNDLAVGTIARVALAEREVISRRTEEASAAAKAWKVKLDNSEVAESLGRAA